MHACVGKAGQAVSLDNELRGFAREHLKSVWGLELLLLLRRDPERCWSVDELVRELRASQMVVNDNLRRLETGGLAAPDDRRCYRFQPASSVLATLCDRIEAAYRERPVAVINMISAPPDPIQGLADAFKFRGDK
jgi:hypothetical protein